jgi:hypothetical protein
MAREKTEVEVSGVVEDLIRFRNSNDGVGVAKVELSSGTEEQVIGVLVGIELGDYIEVTGVEYDHPHHGKQIRAKVIHVLLPKDRRSTVGWLTRHFGMLHSAAEDLISDWYTSFSTVGAATSSPASIYMPAPEGTDFEIARFMQLLRWNDASIRTFFDKHNATMTYPSVQAYVLRKMTVDDLLKLGLDTKEAHALFRARGREAAAELKQDPYTAYYYIQDMPFTKIDKIYLSQRGNAPNDPKRLRAVCLHELKDRADEGHTAMYYDDFLDYMSEKYPTMSAQRFVSCLDQLMPEFLTLYGDPQMIQLVTHARYEAGIAEFITYGKVRTQPPGHEEHDDEDE